MELGCWSHADDGRCLCDGCQFDTARWSKLPPFPSLLFPIFWFSNAECNNAETGRSQWQLVVDLSPWNQVLVICVLLIEVEMLSLRWALGSSFIVCRGMPPSPKMRHHYHHSSVNCDQDSTWVIWHFANDGSIRASSFWFLFHLHIQQHACQINLFNMYQPVTNLPLHIRANNCNLHMCLVVLKALFYCVLLWFPYIHGLVWGNKLVCTWFTLSTMWVEA